MNGSVPHSPAVLVAVLGDLGRSPRMLNHARSFLDRGWGVTLAGLRETELPPGFAAHPALRVIAADLALEAPAGQRARARWRLLIALARERPAWDLVLVQNPPAFPVLAALAWARRRFPDTPRAPVIVDWHNLGHAVLAHAGRNALLVAAYRGLERRFARGADGHWAVSAALAAHLQRWLGPRAVEVLADQPSAWLCAAAQKNAAPDRLAWWRRTLPDVEPPPADARWLAMPSSWTSDEATGLLHDAVALIARGDSAWPAGRRLAVIATGRGPGRAAFAAAMPAAAAIVLRMAWLPAPAYAGLLGHADAGLCLHASASGLDLPLKLADMRGAGLPALAFDYGPALRETFFPGRHGELFRNARELAAALARLAAQPPPRLADAGTTWEETWTAVAGRRCAAPAAAPAAIAVT